MLTPSTGEVLRGSAGVMRCAQQQTIAVITICAQHSPFLSVSNQGKEIAISSKTLL